MCGEILRGSHAGRRVNRVIVGSDKYRENVDITNCALRTLYNRTFYVGVLAHLKVYALVT